jgi:uncharacterized protein YecE (DUF72 family)
MKIWIGTSGYSYGDWVGAFYPTGVRPAGMLEFYIQHFPLVELNFTFYRPPTKAMLLRLANKTPPGFQFLVKLPRTLSHEQSRTDLAMFRQAVEALAERGQLAGLLCQLPQATHNERTSRIWVRSLARELAGLRMAVEFRHRSWVRPGLAAWLAEQHLELVAVDVPDLPGLFPRGWVQAGSRLYVRFHSRNAAAWYKSDKERYDYHYTDAELGEWVEGLRTAQGTEEALLLFNNCQRAQATVNAQRLRALLEHQAPHLDLVAPFASTPPAQRSLFAQE